LASEATRTSILSYAVRLAHRPRLGTEYPRIIEQVAAIMEDLPPLRAEPMLVMDGTGLGAPVVHASVCIGVEFWL
jgi:hypothetical protein